MNTNLLIAADPMMAALLNCERNKPLSADQRNSIHQLDISPQRIAGEHENGGRRMCPLSDLSAAPDFEMLEGVKMLELSNHGVKDCSLPMWKKIQRGLDKLPAVKCIKLWSSKEAQNSLELNRCPQLFARLEKMTVNGNARVLLEQMPKKLDTLLELRVNGSVELEQLLALRAPRLTRLRVQKLNELKSIAQLTAHFPALEELWIGDNKASLGLGMENSVDLGQVSKTLRRLVLSAPELGDWSGLADSNIREMKLMNVEFDPDILPACTRMQVLELEECMITKEMPPLASMKALNYLILNGCMITDYRFARGLSGLQLLNVEKNGLEITDWKKDELPEVLDCLADMPNLLEFVAESEIVEKLLEYCPAQFRRYSNELCPDMLRLKP